MRVWYSDDFEGHWPVGTAAVVVADTEEQARALLNEACKAQALQGFDGTLHEVPTETATAVVIRNGDY